MKNVLHVSDEEAGDKGFIVGTIVGIGEAVVEGEPLNTDAVNRLVAAAELMKKYKMTPEELNYYVESYYKENPKRLAAIRSKLDEVMELMT